ncbi:MAG TPA: preprotein translocase subunit SecY, partial [Allosphingosinicella sp.]
MASAAESMASNLSLANFAKATDLKKRLWFTLGALVIFRLLSFVPLPGIDPRALATLFDTTRGGVLDFFNMFSGGSLERMSLIALGVMPYITASIVVQLATSMSPALAALKKEGESGRKKLNQYTRYGTVFLCAIQGYFIALGLEGWGQGNSGSAVLEPGMMFRITTVVTLVGGTMFLMWLGEQITSRGVGNGISLIIMAGIVAGLPVTLVQLFESGRTGSIDPLRLVLILAAAVGLVLLICFMERAQRRILIQYPKRQTARGVQAERSHLPLKLNTAGVIPPIFASSLLLLPLTITQFAGTATAGESWWGDFVISLIGGTMFLMWIGEQITSRGIGNGISLIIMAGIVAQLPTALAQMFEGGRTGSLDPFVIMVVVALAVGLILFICFMERAQRRVLIQYPKRQTRQGLMQADRSHLPLKVNTA